MRTAGGLMVGKEDFPVEKIQDGKLRRLAERESEDRVSVIIRLNLPSQKVEMERRGGKGGRARRPFRVKAQTAREKKEFNSRAAEAKEFLESLLDEPPIWLELARSFVATVNGKQLRDIATSKLTKAIVPNRTWHLP